MKLRLSEPNRTRAYCMRPHCTVLAGKEAAAEWTNGAARFVSVRFGLEMSSGKTSSIEMNLDQPEDGSHVRRRGALLLAVLRDGPE